VASFLVKHLLIGWREGEQWFWDTLVDADAASNPANWQWVAGSGADARRWVPEIAALPNGLIHPPLDRDAARTRRHRHRTRRHLSRADHRPQGWPRPRACRLRQGPQRKRCDERLTLS
jgi:deoxyribodipyrimidine photolyase